MAGEGAALIQGGLGLGGSIVSGLFASSENRKNRRWQEKMYNLSVENNRQDAEQAHEWQKELQALAVEQGLDYKRRGWSAEVEGLREAGLNPMLALNGGTGGSGGIGAPSSAQAHAASPGNPGMLNMDVSGFNLAAKAAADTALLKSQEALNNAKTDEIRGDTAPVQKSMEQMDANIKELTEKVNLMLTEEGLYNAQSALFNAQTTWQNLQNEITEDTKDFQMQTIRWGLYHKREETMALVEEIKDRRLKRDKEIKLIDAQINLFNRNAEYLFAKIGETSAYRDLLQQQGVHEHAKAVLLYAQMPSYIEMMDWKVKNEKEFRERYEEFLKNQRRGQNLQFLNGVINAFAGAASGFYKAKAFTAPRSMETSKRYVNSNGDFMGGVETYTNYGAPQGLGL